MQRPRTRPKPQSQPVKGDRPTASKPTRRSSRSAAAQSRNLDIERMRQDYAEQGSASDKYFRFPDGRTQMRVLMNPHNGLFYTHILHAFIPNGEGGKTRVVSPLSQDPDAYCPVAEAHSALIRASRKDEANEIRLSDRYFMNAVVKQEGGWKPVWLECPYTVWRDIVRSALDEIDEGDDDVDASSISGIADDKDGRLIVVRRKTKGQRTEYETTVGTKKVPAKREWLDTRSDFAEETIGTNTDEIEDALCVFLGIENLSDLIGEADPPDEGEEYDSDPDDEEVEGDIEEEDEEEDDDENDEGDDEYNEEDDEPEEKPQRTKRRGSKKARRTSSR